MMTCSALSGWFQLLASVLEVAGVLLMANALLSAMPIWEWPQVVFGALLGNKGGSRVAEAFGKESMIVSLRGLALIGIGFSVQGMTVLICNIL